MIYYIGSVGGNCIKIGVSQNPNERLAELQVGNDKTLILLATEYTDFTNFNDDYGYEQYLHSLYGIYNVSGEWFKCNDGLIKRINELSKYYIDYTNDKICVYNKMKF